MTLYQDEVEYLIEASITKKLHKKLISFGYDECTLAYKLCFFEKAMVFVGGQVLVLFCLSVMQSVLS